MAPFDLLGYVTGIAQSQGLQYFITGSTATIFYGEPRYTLDIDMVLAINASQVQEFCRQFPGPDFYVSESAAHEAINRHSQFNIIHIPSGLKVDVIVPEPSLFNRTRFKRTRTLQTPTGAKATFASPEDVIIKKMEYYKLGGSEKHIRDIASVVKLNPNKIDIAYITQWADELGVSEIWSIIQEKLKTR
jgi:hypothetical protein